MPDQATDFHDPTVRALALVGAGVVYTVAAVPTVLGSSLPQLIGLLAVAGLTAVVIPVSHRPSTASGTDDSDGRPLLSVVGCLAAIGLFEYGLGTLALGIRDGVAELLVVAGVGVAGGFLVVCLRSMVRHSQRCVWANLRENQSRKRA